MKFLKVFLVISLLIFTFSSTTKVTEAAGTGVINSYITVNSVTKNTDGTITVKYTMKKKFNTTLMGNMKQSLSIGYQMNPIYKLPSVRKSVNTKKGTHTLTLPKPSNDFLGYQEVKINYGASGGYSESKPVKTVHNVPKNLRGIKRSYKTITKAQAAGEKIVSDYFPGLTITLLLKGKSATIKNVAKKATGIASTIVGFNLATGVIKQMPSLTAGYVVYYETEIKTNGKIKNRIMVFANKATYNEFVKSKYKKSSLSIYDNSSTTNLKF